MLVLSYVTFAQLDHQCLFSNITHFYECFCFTLFLVMKLLTSQNYVLFVVEYGSTFVFICLISARWRKSIYVTEGSYSTSYSMYVVAGEYNGKTRMWWEWGIYSAISSNVWLLHGKVFCGFKQCANDTWQSILWFQTVCEWYIANYFVVSSNVWILHGNVFCCFKQNMLKRSVILINI